MSEIRALRLAVAVLFPLLTCSVYASDSKSIFDQIGQSEGVSPTVLYGIALQESGVPGTQTPWPWTANINGKSHWFMTKEDARRAIEKAIKSGAKNVDIGLMQINWYWHGHRFESVDHALDPRVNLRAAAVILKQFDRDPLFVAIGRYHCPSNETWCRQKAHQYALRVVEKLRRL